MLANMSANSCFVSQQISQQVRQVVGMADLFTDWSTAKTTGPTNLHAHWADKSADKLVSVHRALTNTYQPRVCDRNDIQNRLNNQISTYSCLLSVCKKTGTRATCVSSRTAAAGEALLTSGSYWTNRSSKSSESWQSLSPGGTSWASVTKLSCRPCTTAATDTEGIRKTEF